MIVPMREVVLLASPQRREALLHALRDLGVVHVESLSDAAAPAVQQLEGARRDVERALEVLAEDGATDPGAKGPTRETADVGEPGDATRLTSEILELAARRGALAEEAAELAAMAAWHADWGAAAPADLARLADAGLSLRFYEAPADALSALPEGAVHRVLHRDRDGIRLVTVGGEPLQDARFRESVAPAAAPDEVQRRRQTLTAEARDLETRRRRLAPHVERLRHHLDDLDRQIEFGRVLHGMEDREPVALLRGYVPARAEGQLRDAVGDHGAACLVREPADPDTVPTQVETSRWARVVEPVFGFMGTVPGYREYDISAWFLIFFSLFTGMLIGDAGYGLVLLGGTLWASRRWPQADRHAIRLGYVLGGATTLWGALSGSWFGSSTLAGLPVLRDLVYTPISNADPDSQATLMFFSFVIGVTHLTLAHLLAAFRHRSLRSLAEIGWIATLWSLFLVARHLVLAAPLPDLAWPLGGGGVLLTLLFSNASQGLLRGLGATLADLPLKVIGAFSDIVSYLRLFAVGYATVIVASSFNDMAAGFGGSVGGIIGAVAVLLLGHTINLAMGLMAVLVHGIRLNMLEFSGHLDMQWSGRPYTPFR